MPKRPAKTQASSTRAASGSVAGGFGSSSATSVFGTSSSPLSYVSEAPDLFSISDPNIVVAFKNLSKKDSTTKSKALEELQTHFVASKGDFEEGVLETWITFYPRTSIDNARRVRQLAHTLQGLIAVASGKRIAKYMPQVVGAWLAGSYDSDRSVSKAAQDALKQAFPSPEKQANVRKAYQEPILEFCRNVIDNETPQTLSDERSSSTDEVEAKYSRVLATSISLVASLLNDLGKEEIERHETTYADLIRDGELWKLAYYSDPAVRRAVHRLLRVCISKQPQATKAAMSSIGTAYMHHALRSDQTSTSLDYIECLIALVRFDPDSWTNNFKGPKGKSRLCSFLKRGSQFGPSEFWSGVSHFFESLPQESFTGSEKDSAEILGAMHAGINKKEEPRSNLTAAYRAYINVAALMAEAFPMDESKHLLQSSLMPILQQYVRPSSDQSEWSLPDSNSATLISQLLDIPTMYAIAVGEWPSITQQLMEDMAVSLPEQAKEFDASQSAVGKQGTRWASVQATLIRKEADKGESGLSELTAQVLASAFDLLKRRNGKPYGAAIVAEQIAYELAMDSNTEQKLKSFVENELPDIFISPSAPYLAGLLYRESRDPIFQSIWEKIVQHIVRESDTKIRDRSLKAILTSQRLPRESKLVSDSPALKSFLLQQTEEALNGQHDWSFITSLPKQSADSLESDTADHMLANMMKSLSTDDVAPRALEGLQVLTKSNRKAVEQFIRKPDASLLLPRLLHLSESSDVDTAQAASNLNNLIQSNLSLSQNNGNNSSTETLFRTIQSGLFEASEMSVSVDTLVQIARDFIQRHESTNSEAFIGLMPSVRAWEEALSPFLSIPPLPSLSITSPLGGAVYLVQTSDIAASRSESERLSRDDEGYSVAMRIAKFVTAVLPQVMNKLPGEDVTQIFRFLILTKTLVNHNISVAGANDLWSFYSPGVETETVNLLSNMQMLISGWLQRESVRSGAKPDGSISPVKNVTDSLRGSSVTSSAESFYCAESYCSIVSDLIEIYPPAQDYTGQVEQQLVSLRKERKVTSLVAIFAAHTGRVADSKLSVRYCNELVSDLTTLDLAAKPDEGLEKLILLNAVRQSLGDMTAVAKQRIIFLVKHILPWLTMDVSEVAKAEAFGALTGLLPAMGDMYGDYWEQVLTAITSLWSWTAELSPDGLLQQYKVPCLYASVRLYNILRSMVASDDANDDLVEAWNDSQKQASDGLLHILQSCKDAPDEYNQPLRVLNELVGRLISRMSLKDVGAVDDVYAMLASPSQSIQQAAYDLVHRKTPSVQEQVSLEAALSKMDAKLPEELISLVLEAPTALDVEDGDWQRGIPLPLRGYLLSWLLIFDQFEHASYKVKNDYLVSLKEVATLPPLLSFIFDFLGHSRGRPVDISKFDVTNYSVDMSSSEAPLKDAQHMLAHLYFLSLKHVPSLVKTWWLELRSRALVSSVEAWTERFISPHIIAVSLAAVSQWASEQTDPSNPNVSAENENFRVTVSLKAKEIRAGYDFEEQTLSIVIRLPDAFPLRQAEVQGVSRVGVDERKWQSWVRGCQGVITFSNNNITDGLLAFRRNVVGAMKGHTECAICYSVISADKQLPSKRCSTCKNLFHSGCLYRWFKTSNASTCPLCRNPFNYG